MVIKVRKAHKVDELPLGPRQRCSWLAAAEAVRRDWPTQLRPSWVAAPGVPLPAHHVRVLAEALLELLGFPVCQE